MPKNRYGLSRNIPVDVKTGVRRRCGFGCVICGNAIVTYEHFDPVFTECRSHSVHGITLLCGSHQIQSTKGLLSKDTIKAANLNPFCRHQAAPSHLFDLGGQRPSLIFGSNDFSRIGPGIWVDGEPFIRIHEPDKGSSLWRLSARFKNEGGHVECEIRENELLLNSLSADIVQTTNRFTIVGPNNSIWLELELRPPNALIVKKYKTVTKIGIFEIGEAQLSDFVPKTPNHTGMRTASMMKIGGLVFVDCKFQSEGGISVTSSGFTLMPGQQNSMT